MYGTSVLNEQSWSELMNQARARTNITGQKTKVVASINSPRAARFYGAKYHYTILLAEQPYEPYCAEIGPNGKPCIVPLRKHSYASHVCRSEKPGYIVVWSYVYPVTRNLTPEKTSAVTCHTLTVQEAKEIGCHYV